MISKIWSYLLLVASCLASDLSGDKQALVLRAALSDGFTEESFSPSVEEFLTFHFAPRSVSLPVHALILEHTLDRANPDLVTKVMALTGYEAPKAIRVIQVWFRYCIDRAECDEVGGKQMMLKSRAVRSYTEMMMAILPRFAPIDPSKLTTSGIEDLGTLANHEGIFAVPNWMFRLMDHHVSSSLVTVVELIYASSSEYSQDEILAIVKIWRQFCLLERQRGIYFNCYMGEGNIWHLDGLATKPRIMYALQHPEESVAPSQAAIEFETLATGVEMFAPGVFVDIPPVPSSLMASENTNEQTVSLKRLTQNSDKPPENEKRRKAFAVQRTTSIEVTPVETSSSATMGNAFESTFTSMRDGLLAGWKDAYDVAEADMGIVLYLINVMFLEPQRSPTDPESVQYSIYQHLKRPIVATPEFVALLQTHQDLPVSELAKLITEREPSNDLTYRNVKKTIFCIIIWRQFGNGAILNDRHNFHLNRRMLFAYLTELGSGILPSTTD